MIGLGDSGFNNLSVSEFEYIKIFHLQNSHKVEC